MSPMQALIEAMEIHHAVDCEKHIQTFEALRGECENRKALRVEIGDASVAILDRMIRDAIRGGFVIGALAEHYNPLPK